jgi:GxxExxY protein
MDESPKEIICKDEVHAIVGCAFEVLNTLGCGLLEKPYENAPVVEFGLRKIPFMQQEHYNVVYKGVTVGFYIPDLVAYDKAVIDTKVIDRITDT